MIRNARIVTGVAGLGLGILVALIAYQSASRSTPAAAQSLSWLERNEDRPSPAGNPNNGAAESRTLLTAATSAYSAHLFPRADEIVVVTPTQLIRWTAGARVEKYEVQIGHLAAQLEDSIVYFREGALRTLSLDSMEEAELFPLKVEPQYLLTSGPRVAWLKRDPSGLHSIETSAAAELQLLYSSHHVLSAPVLHEESVYFVESSGGRWRMGRAPLNGSQVTFGPEHTTRQPSLLAAGPDGIYFYDGPARSVVKATFNLRREQAISQRVICSPLAVSSRVVCARVGGVFDIPRPGANPRPIALETSGPIADLAVFKDTVYWIADSGDHQMTVKAARLSGLLPL